LNVYSTVAGWTLTHVRGLQAGLGLIGSRRWTLTEERQHKVADAGMLTRRKLLVVACALLLLGACVWFSSGAPTHASICEENSQTHADSCSSHNIAFVVIRHVVKFFDDHNGSFSALFAAAVAIFTWFLWKATVGLGASTDKLWAAGERQIAVAKDAADAAKRSTDAFRSAEKAHLFIDIKQETVAKIVSTYGRWDKSDGMFESDVDTPSVAYFFTNIGRTAAIMKELSNRLVF
jgi:hypothetical protein